MSTDGIANLDFGYASLEGIGGIGKVGFVSFALRGKEIGKVRVVEELVSRQGMFMQAYLREAMKSVLPEAAQS
jgi:hypothetical protein